MKMHLMLRSVPSKTQSVIDKHAEFKARLAKHGPILGLSVSKIPGVKEPTDYLSVVSLTKALPSRAKGSLNYENRKALEDDDQHDDWLAIEFEAGTTLDKDLLSHLPKLASDFSAYILELGSLDLLTTDFDRWQKWARAHNGRHEVFRIFPVVYYSAGLCKSAFQMTPKKLCSRLAGHVALCQEIAGGAYIIGNREPMTIAEAKRYDKRIRSLLTS